MNIDFSRTSHIIFFAGLLPGVSLGVAYIMSRFWETPPFWIETLSPLATYALLYTLFDRSAWRWRIFRWVGIVHMKPLHGRWYGTQLSSYKDKNGEPTESHIIMEIEQTFSQVVVSTYYKRWQSPRCASSFLRIDGNTYLVILFETEPRVFHTTTKDTYKGVARLRYSPKQDKLIGSYFNSHGNYGEITLRRSPKPLLHAFE